MKGGLGVGSRTGCIQRYWTPAGLISAKKEITTADKENMSMISGLDGSTLLVPTASTKELHYTIQDQDLTWDEFAGADPRMIQDMQWVKWPADRITMLLGGATPPPTPSDNKSEQYQNTVTIPSRTTEAMARHH